MPSARSCPAFGTPTIMPYCCCTVGSDAVGSIRPNSIGGVLCGSPAGRLAVAVTAAAYSSYCGRIDDTFCSVTSELHVPL